MTDRSQLQDWVRDLLRCPVTGARLVDSTAADGSPELVCTDRDRTLAYPVRDGIPVLLADEAREIRTPQNHPQMVLSAGVAGSSDG